MKKSLIFVSVLAFAGLFASCQKENVVAPEQTSEQKVITINPNGFKGDADIEPLIALNQALNLPDIKDDKKDVSLVKKILRDFFRTIANLIGSNETDYPTYRSKYFGNWRTFGAAIAEIQGLSYDARVPYIEFELGNATDLKIGRVEVMPYTDFYFDFEGGAFNGGRIDDGGEIIHIDPPIVGAGRPIADTVDIAGPVLSTILGHPAKRRLSVGSWNGLIVKFESRKGTYAFAIGVEGEAGLSPNDNIMVEFQYGYFDSYFDTLEEWYEANMYNKTYDGFPIDATTEFGFDTGSNYYESGVGYKDCWFYNEGIDFEVTTLDEALIGASACITLGYDYYGDDYYYRMISYAEDKTAAKDFCHDYIWADLFGCDESEGKALIEEYHNAFTDTLYLFGWYNDGGWTEATFGTNPTISLEAKGLRWKPVFGFSYECTDGTVFVPFKEYTANDCDSDEYKSFWNYLAWDTSLQDKYLHDGWNVFPGLVPKR